MFLFKKYKEEAKEYNIFTFIFTISVVYFIFRFISNRYKKMNSFINYISTGSIDNVIPDDVGKKSYKRNVSESKKKIVASSQHWKCKICDILLKHTYEIDHINPLYKGGDNELNNLQALCRECH